MQILTQLFCLVFYVKNFPKYLHISKKILYYTIKYDRCIAIL